MASDSPYQRRAERHEARARNYLQKAEMLLNEYDDPDSAGALMYEAAKQCVNAVANQRGSNPGTTGGKINALRSIEARITQTFSGAGDTRTGFTFMPIEKSCRTRNS